MRALIVVAASIATLVGGVYASPLVSNAAQVHPVIVVYDDTVSAASTTRTLERALGFVAENVYTTALPGFAARLAPEQIARLAADSRVAYVTKDTPLSIAGSVPVELGETVPTGVRRIEATSLGRVHEPSPMAVAVVDSGIDLSHPDLNALDGVSCVAGTSSAQDDNGHGTHVAGTIAALNNGTGVIGVAPGTQVVAVKVVDRFGVGTVSSTVCGLDWVAKHAKTLNITVANLSLAAVGASDTKCGRTNRDPLHKAICKTIARGVTIVAAAGNDGADFAGIVPAAYPEVLTVTAIADADGAPGATGRAPTCEPTEVDDAASTFSNFAQTTAEASHVIAAPGVCIHSTWLGGGHATLSGTSMAAPHVSGTIALCFGSGVTTGPCKGLASADVRQRILTDAAGQSSPTATPYYGFTGDNNRPVAGRIYGYLAWAGGG